MPSLVLTTNVKVENVPDFVLEFSKVYCLCYRHHHAHIVATAVAVCSDRWVALGTAQTRMTDEKSMASPEEARTIHLN